MESKSIYRQFYSKLIIATSLFIIALSFIFYEYARSTVYDDIQKICLITQNKFKSHQSL